MGPGPRRAGQRDLEGQSRRSGCTGGGALYVTRADDPADQPHLLGNRQSGAALRFRLIGPGDNLFTESTRRVRCRDRQEQVVLPVHRLTTTTDYDASRLADHRLRQGQRR